MGTDPLGTGWMAPGFYICGMLAFGILEWSFIAILVVLVGAAGLFALFLILQLFRNPSRRP